MFFVGILLRAVGYKNFGFPFNRGAGGDVRL